MRWLDGIINSMDLIELEQIPGDGDGQGSLVCCSPWGQKELDMIEGLNDSNNNSHLLCHNLGGGSPEVTWILSSSGQ